MKTRLYRHYKNKNYKFLGLVRHSETLEEMAMYETLYPNDLGNAWVRPKEMFFGKIEVGQQKVDRFHHVQFEFEVMTQLNEESVQAIESVCIQCGISFKEIKSEKTLVQIAYDLENPVAVKIGFNENESTFVSYLTAVIPTYQNLGLASVLTENQHQWCKQNKINKVISTVNNENTKALRFTLKFDFKVIEFTEGSKNVILEKNLI